MFRAACLAAFALASVASSQELVLQKEGTQHYHRPGCAAIGDGRGVLAMTRAQADARGLKPHPDCDPARVTPDPATAGSPPSPGSSTAARGSAKPVFVFVDAGKESPADRGKLYHREDCSRLGKERRKVSVDAAAKQQYWPCPKCKPPIRKRPMRLGRHGWLGV